MARTVIGLFDNETEAQNVKRDLMNQGYSAENIRIVTNNEPIQAGVTSAVTEPSEAAFVATIGNFFHSLPDADAEDRKHYTESVRTGEALMAVTVADERADSLADFLETRGAEDVQEDDADLSATSAKGELGNEPDQKLNVVEEELQVGKRQVERGGVRVYSHVTERPVEENITLRDEHVHVERRPVNRAATEADFEAFKEGSIELTETAEEAVISKTSRVVEEIVVSKDVSERRQTISDTVRRTDVKVERIGAEQPGTSSDVDFEPDFRKHFASTYSKSGASFDTYAPAYQYGQRMASDPRYTQSDWSKVETSARKDWSNQGAGTWEEMKAAIRQGWDKARGAAGAR